MSDKPTIEFPCDGYPIKVIAVSDAELKASVIEIVKKHDDTLIPETVTVQNSSEGNYSSVRLSIRATGEAQLKAMHKDLMSHPLVKMVL